MESTACTNLTEKFLNGLMPVAERANWLFFRGLAALETQTDDGDERQLGGKNCRVY